MLIDIDKIVVGDRIRKDFGDIQELAEDIKENTLLNALVVTPSGNGDGTYLLIAGERRLRACKMLGYRAVPVNTVGVDDAEQALMMEISENECRKEFTKTERLEYARRLALIEGAKAKERMSEGGKGTQDIAGVGETRAKVAQALGTNRETLRQEQIIADNADLLDPADFADWDEGKLSTNKAYQRIKAAKEQAERERNQARQELDAAQQDLADAWQAQEDAETEAVMLKRKLESVEKPKPEVVEVVPEDYEATKRKVDSLRHDNDVYLDTNRKLREQLESTRKELDKAKDILGMDKTLQDVRRDVQYLITATNSYVRRYGGLTWTVQQLGEVDEPTLDQLRKAVRNLATFSNALMTSLENTNE